MSPWLDALLTLGAILGWGAVLTLIGG